MRDILTDRSAQKKSGGSGLLSCPLTTVLNLLGKFGVAGAAVDKLALVVAAGPLKFYGWRDARPLAELAVWVDGLKAPPEMIGYPLGLLTPSSRKIFSAIQGASPCRALASWLRRSRHLFCFSALVSA